MKHITREITEEEYKQAQEKGSDSLVPEYVVCGYGLYGSNVYEQDGKYFLKWVQGASCD